MNKKLMSIMSLVLAVCFLAVMAAGCTSGAKTPEGTPAPGAEATKAPDDDQPAETKKVSFTQFWNMASHNIEQTEIFVELLKRTNVDVTYEVPTSDDGQKLNIMMSSGALPEIVSTPRTNAAVGKMIDAGAVYCINDLMEQYYPSMLTDIEPEYFAYHKYKDGKNYYWTNYIYTPFVLSHDTWPKVEAVFRNTNVRADVWEAIGKPDVSTPEAYKAMLMQIKEKFPDLPTYYMQGYPTSSVAAGQSEGSLFINSDSPSWGLFGEWGLTQYDVADDKVTSVIRNPKFFEMVSYLNDLYRSGLLDASCFVDGSDIANQKIDNGQIASFHGTIGNHGYTAGVEYATIPYFTEINGEAVEGFYNKSGAGWLATMVTSKTTGDVLEGVMRFLGYQATMEGRQLCGWGIEGRHWEWNDDKSAPVQTEVLTNMADPSDKTKKFGFWQNRALHDQYYCNSLWETWTDERLAWYEVYGDRMKLDIFDGVRNPPLDDSAEGIILAKLIDHSFVYYPKMVMAESADQCKAMYDEFVSKCEADGLVAMEKYWTDKWVLFK
ncbi:MAG: extracellular solute-binding protein [Eubacteriales bacterium]|nr:extracellular solute-binding protein [Eubacteriales bacterium]